jgi:DNA-binding transcriptional MerR regulator
MTQRRLPGQGLALREAASATGVPVARVRHYVSVGVIRPARVGEAATFGERELARLRRIRRLQDDLGVNTAGVEIVIRLLDEIERLQTDMRRRPR